MPDLGMRMQGGSLQSLPPNATKEQQTAVINDIIAKLNNILKGSVYADSANKRMLIGYQKDGWGVGQDFGIKVSLEGVDVTTAADEELLFKMAMDNWKWRDNEGRLIKEFDIAGGTTLDYDPVNNKNFMQSGKLPDGTYGVVSVKEGSDVADAY